MLALHRYNIQKKKFKDQSLYLFYLNLFKTKRAEMVITWIGNNMSLIMQLWVEEKAGNLQEITSAW